MSVRELGLSGASDGEVFTVTQERHAILITSDLDFSNILTFPLGSHSGIVIVRIPDSFYYLVQVRRIVEVLQAEELDELVGSLLVIDMQRRRIRRL